MTSSGAPTPDRYGPQSLDTSRAYGPNGRTPTSPGGCPDSPAAYDASQRSRPEIEEAADVPEMSASR